jgi:hypothetical protein
MLPVEKFAVPFPLKFGDFKIDDRFAQEIGATMLNMLALGQANLKQYMSRTQYN